MVTLANEAYVRQPMVTMIGNKRKLIVGIYEIVREVWAALGLSEGGMKVMDGFAGSGVVSRMLASAPEVGEIWTNDLEYFSYIMMECFLKKPEPSEEIRVREHIIEMNRLAASGPYLEGVVTRLYAPRVTASVAEGERCFYTHENALIIDTLRNYIERRVESSLRPWLLAPLLIKASIHTNTGGVFKGFYKKDGVGHFGGEGENALERIMAPIRLEAPRWPLTATGEHLARAHTNQEDVNALMERIPDGSLDLIYFDPPYNQHPYGSNYFMLNVIAEGTEPHDLSGVSGIPRAWNKSRYNKAREATEAMKDLLTKALKKTKYVLISYNNEGIIETEAWQKLLEGREWRLYERPYDTYKASRNLDERAPKVVERLYLVCAPGIALP